MRPARRARRTVPRPPPSPTWAWLLGGLLLAARPAAAQPAHAERLTEHTLAASDSLHVAEAAIADVAWLVGSWRGDGLGGVNHETWLPPADGALVGLYRLAVDEAPVFYEVLTIRERDGTLVLDLKHFDPDLRGWEAPEETVTFPLVHIESEAAYFRGLTYARDGPNGLRIWLALRSADGTLREEAFTLRRVPPEP